MLVLLFVALWFVLRGDLFKVFALFYFVLECFQFSIATALLGEERELILVLSYVCSICACLVLSVSSSWEGLRLVTVVLPGLFSYLFRFVCKTCFILLIVN